MQFTITLASGTTYTYEGTVEALTMHLKKNEEKGNIIASVTSIDNPDI